MFSGIILNNGIILIQISLAMIKTMTTRSLGREDFILPYISTQSMTEGNQDSYSRQDAARN